MKKYQHEWTSKCKGKMILLQRLPHYPSTVQCYSIYSLYFQLIYSDVSTGAYYSAHYTWASWCWLLNDMSGCVCWTSALCCFYRWAHCGLNPKTVYKRRTFWILYIWQQWATSTAAERLLLFGDRGDTANHVAAQTHAHSKDQQQQFQLCVGTHISSLL